MIESLIGTIAIVALIIVVARQNSRLGLLEREIGALRSFVLANPPAAGETPKAVGRPIAQADVLAEAPATETPAPGTVPAGPQPAEPALSQDRGRPRHRSSPKNRQRPERNSRRLPRRLYRRQRR